MTYKVGTRVKKVRSNQAHNLGATGVVCSGPAHLGFTLDRSTIGADIYIRMDQVWVTDSGREWPSGTVCMAISEQWEPVIPEGSDVSSEVTIHELLDSKFYEKENCNV